MSFGYETLVDSRRSRTAADAYQERQRRRDRASLPVEEKFQLANIFSRDRLYRTGLRMQVEAGDAAGPDGVRPSQLSRSEIGQMAGKLHIAIADGTYRPGPRRAFSIAKPHGGTRTLWIPNFPDRVVARVLFETIQPLLDPLFFETSFGFRPNRGTWQMLATIKTMADFHSMWVLVNADVRKAFDTVQIPDVMQAFVELFETTEVSHCSHDTQQDLRRFIEDILQAGNRSRTVGIDTGCPFSPLALNVLLHTKHDVLFQEGLNKPLWIRDCEEYRYADNLVALVPSVPQGRQLLDGIQTRLNQCGLALKDDAEVIDLRSETSPIILGFQPRRQNNYLVYNFPPGAIDQFAKHLQEAYREPQPSATAREIARGWVCSIGPAVEGNGWELLPRIAQTLDAHGFRDCCSRVELREWWVESCRQWLGLLETVRKDKELFIRKEWE